MIEEDWKFLQETCCQDCLDLHATFNPMNGWETIVSDCVLGDFEGDDLAEVVHRARLAAEHRDEISAAQ